MTLHVHKRGALGERAKYSLLRLSLSRKDCHLICPRVNCFIMSALEQTKPLDKLTKNGQLS